MRQLKTGDQIAARRIETFDGQTIGLPNSIGLTHLQFRRFAGCPICNLHLHSFIQRQQELNTAGITEIAVFHSAAQELQASGLKAPFAVVADPQETLYREFGVATSYLSILHPQTAWTGIRGLLKFGLKWPEKLQSFAMLPTDFLIAPDGTVLECHHGEHPDDQWSLDELLNLAAKHKQGLSEPTT